VPGMNGRGAGGTEERVALYLRVSSEEQRERETIDIQREFLEQYCGLYGLEVAGIYEDDGFSGTVPMAERSEGWRLLNDAKASEFGTVLVSKLDRLGRSLLVIFDAHDRLADAGAALRSGREPIDTSNPSGRLIFQMLASFAEYDRENIAERTQAGLRRAFRKGTQLGCIPFGYDVNEGNLGGGFVVVEEEARIVREIVANVAGGATLYSEAKRLNDEGEPSPGRKYRGRPRKHGPAWCDSTVRGIVTQSAYGGVHIVKARGGPIERPVPAIVEPALQQQALARLEQNKRYSGGRKGRNYLLRGFVARAHCGTACAGDASVSSTGYRYHYYSCRRKRVTSDNTTRGLTCPQGQGRVARGARLGRREELPGEARRGPPARPRAVRRRWERERWERTSRGGTRPSRGAWRPSGTRRAASSSSTLKGSWTTRNSRPTWPTSRTRSRTSRC
jgi:site-specific DNA recombinase